MTRNEQHHQIAGPIRAVLYAPERLVACELRNLTPFGVILRTPIHRFESSRLDVRFRLHPSRRRIVFRGFVVCGRRSGLETEWKIRFGDPRNGVRRTFDDYVVRILEALTGTCQSSAHYIRVIGEPALPEQHGQPL